MEGSEIRACNFGIIGDVRCNNTASQDRAKLFLQDLAALMQKYEIIKLDVCQDPYYKPSIKEEI